MLPHRSKRYAGIDGEIPRLKLATGWQLLLIGFMVVTLLAVVFPRKELVAKLYEQETLDELTLSYIQNLYRASAGNLDVALLLARVQQQKLDLPTLRLMLLSAAAEGDLRQRTAARTILLSAYDRRLQKSTNAEQLAELRQGLPAFLDPALADSMTESMAQQFADLAFTLDNPDAGLQFIAKTQKSSGPDALERYAVRGLARGNYEQAARYYFMAQQQAEPYTDKRRLFMAGVDTLMAGGLYARAMSAANTHLGALAQDRVTLRYLARVALAAGYPNEANAYAKALIFQPQGAQP